MRRLLLALAVTGLVAACAARVDTPDVEVSAAPVKIRIGGGPPGYFCPPGQAKKGNC